LNVTVETTPESDAQFHVQITWNEIEKTSNRVYEKVAKQQNIPGFRPGKAPRAIVERMVGKDYLYMEAIEELVENGVRDLARERDLTLLSAPHVHLHEINFGEEHEVDVTLPVLVKGELAPYDDIQIARDEVVVTEEDVDAIIDRARNQMAIYVPLERPAQIGDRVTVDLMLMLEGREKPVNDLKDNDFDLVEERTGIFTGLDQQIVGMVDGETKTFTLTLPEDYGKEEFAGKEANYTVTLNKTTIKELPAIDDSFAKEAGNFDSVEAMRQGVRDDLIQSRQNTARRATQDKIIDALIERLTLPLPEVLVDSEADEIMQEFANTLASNRMNMDQYLKLMGKTAAQYREDMRPEAERRIKQRRVLELVADLEGLTVSIQELQTLLDVYAQMNNGTRTRVNQLKSTQRLVLERSLARDKALSALMDRLVVAPSEIAVQSAAVVGDELANDSEAAESETTPVDSAEVVGNATAETKDALATEPSGS